jgi:tetratricopeptide (TPR) repeat protein
MRCLGGVIALVAVLAAGPLSALSQRDQDDCSSGDPDRQIAGCTRIIEDKSASVKDRFISHYNRGNAYRDKRDWDKALADYSAAIRLDPKHPYGYNNRGIVHRVKGNFESALADFSEAIKLDPKHARALSNRCWTQAIIGAELKRALADCNESLRLNNKDDNTFDSRGFTYLKLGDWERAIADYDKALSFYRRRAWSLYGRGWAKLKKGDKSGEADIAAAKAITPDIAEQFAAYGVK